ncbi:MAG: hypothetical protein HKO95_08275 [Rhodobacteraceae bacterium]|nr:hypothetical protein [Alphaproteobacteria bacterium]NNK66718.1 hypothetical protein [Paracoccaceae bacterium]
MLGEFGVLLGQASGGQSGSDFSGAPSWLHPFLNEPMAIMIVGGILALILLRLMFKS